MLEVVEYVDENGRSPFGIWFDNLDVQAATKVLTALRRMEAGNFGDVKPVGDGVLERRIDWGPGLRLYFAKDGPALILLILGGTKRRQQKDIETAQALWSAYKRRRLGV